MIENQLKNSKMSPVLKMLSGYQLGHEKKFCRKLVNGWHNSIPTAIFLKNEGYDSENNFEGFKNSKEMLFQKELLDYAKKNLNIDIMEEYINECFDIDNDVSVVSDLSSSEIIYMVLKPHQIENNDEEYPIEEKISNEKCVEIKRQLIHGMEQKSSVNEIHIMAAYKIQELFLKQKSNFKLLNVDEMLNKKISFVLFCSYFKI